MKVDIDSFDFASVSKQFRILDDMKIPESIKDSVDELQQNDALEYEKMGEILNNCIEKIFKGTSLLGCPFCDSINENY